MGKLKLECIDKRLKLKKLSKAVYTALLQTANLKAEIVFMDKDNMQNLNCSTRGVDVVTDVLSYPSLSNIFGVELNPKECVTEMDGKYIFIGSIVLCEERIIEQAKEIGHSEAEERDYLIIHGLLHLMGYDHMTEEDKAVMREREEQIRLILSESKRRKEQKEICKKEKNKTKIEVKKYRDLEKAEILFQSKAPKEESKEEIAKLDDTLNVETALTNDLESVSEENDAPKENVNEDLTQEIKEKKPSTAKTSNKKTEHKETKEKPPSNKPEAVKKTNNVKKVKQEPKPTGEKTVKPTAKKNAKEEK